MCIISQHISIIARNQENLERPKISNLDMIDTMRNCFVDEATKFDSFQCSGWVQYNVGRTRKGLSEVSWNGDVYLVGAGGEVKLFRSLLAAVQNIVP